MEFRGIMGVLYRISEWIMRLSVINILWIISAFPFSYLALNFFFNRVTVELMILLAVLAPFTIIPSTTAMFAVARKWVMGEVDAPMFRTFFRGYKDNYLQSMLGGIVFIVLGVLIIVNYQFYIAQSSTIQLFSFLFVMMFVLLLAAFFNFLSIMVHLHMKLFAMVKNSILVTIGSPLMTISLLATNFIILYISNIFLFFVPFFMGSAMAAVSFFYFNRSYQKIQLRMEKLAEAERRKAGIVDSTADEDVVTGPNEPHEKQLSESVVQESPLLSSGEAAAEEGENKKRQS